MTKLVQINPVRWVFSSFIPFDQVEGGKTDKVRCCLMWRTLILSRVLERLGRVGLIFFLRRFFRSLASTKWWNRGGPSTKSGKRGGASSRWGRKFDSGREIVVLWRCMHALQVCCRFKLNSDPSRFLYHPCLVRPSLQPLKILPFFPEWHWFLHLSKRATSAVY